MGFGLTLSVKKVYNVAVFKGGVSTYSPIFSFNAFNKTPFKLFRI